MIRRRPIRKTFTAWHAQIAEWKARAPFHYGVTEEVARSEHMREHLAGPGERSHPAANGDRGAV